MRLGREALFGLFSLRVSGGWRRRLVVSPGILDKLREYVKYFSEYGKRGTRRCCFFFQNITGGSRDKCRQICLDPYGCRDLTSCYEDYMSKECGLVGLKAKEKVGSDDGVVPRIREVFDDPKTSTTTSTTTTTSSPTAPLLSALPTGDDTAETFEELLSPPRTFSSSAGDSEARPPVPARVPSTAAANATTPANSTTSTTTTEAPPLNAGGRRGSSAGRSKSESDEVDGGDGAGKLSAEDLLREYGRQAQG